MALRSLGAFALASASAVSAFQNTSPFFLFTNSNKPLGLSAEDSPQLMSAISIESLVGQSVKDCAAESLQENYIIVHQDGVAASDYQDSGFTPYLSRWLGGKESEVKQTLVVPEVVGMVNTDAIVQSIKSRCGGSSMIYNGEQEEVHNKEAPYPRVFTVKFPALPAEDPASKLFEHDSTLNNLIQKYFTDEQWTVFYTTTPRTEQVIEKQLATQTYEMDDPFPNAVNMELKRDVVSHANDEKLEGGLFEKYMFLSPGIFMGLTAALPLFLVLYVGISAISGLEVSYFAFSKEMGPAGKKQ